MNGNHNNLDRMLSLLRANPPAKSLLSTSDVRMLLEKKDAEGEISHTRNTISRRGIIMSIVGAVLVGGAALYLATGVDRPQSGIARLEAPARQQTSLPIMPSMQHDSSATTGESQSISRQRSVQGDSVKSSKPLVKSGKGEKEKWETPDGRTIPGVMRITRVDNDSADAAREVEAEMHRDTSRNIAGMKFLELTPAELEKLNVHITPSGIEVVAEDRFVIRNQQMAEQLYRQGFDTSYHAGITRYKIVIDTFELRDNDKVILSPDQKPLQVAPVAVMSNYVKALVGPRSYGSILFFYDRAPLLTERNASSRQLLEEMGKLQDGSSSSMFDANADEFPTMSKLVPIYIRLGNDTIPGTRKRRGSDIFLWYFPTKEFVSALPERYRIPLQKELDVIADVEAQCLTTGEVCQRLTGEPTFLDFCRKSGGAISSTSVYPNPASGPVTFRYLLTQPRRVAITLHNLSGGYIRELAGYQEESAGEHAMTFDPQNLSSGTYMIAVRTSSGEQAVQRVIVQ
jgi:hypothetical protein